MDGMIKLYFKYWLAETYGSTGGQAPEKQDPTKFPGAWASYSAPGSDELPPTQRNNFKMKKKCKKR